MIFISHSSKDTEITKKVCTYLESHGLTCWIAPRDIQPGSPYPSQIVSAIRECTGFLLIASNHVNQSNHINSEVARAFDQKKTIYPFLVDNVSFSDDYIYYLGQIQWINAYSDFEQGLQTLLSVVNTHEHHNTPLTHSPQPSPASNNPSLPAPSNIRIATFAELTQIGLTAIQIAEQLVANDYRLYPEMSRSNEGTPEQWAEYLSTYPETFRYLITEQGDIIGNWSFLAVSEDIHTKRLNSGELEEQSFRIDETEFLLFPGDYVGYLLNLSVNEGYNNAKNINMLITTLIDQMVTFAEDGIFFKSWFVNVFRKDHEAMYKRMGFSYLLDNKSYGKLYTMTCNPLPVKSLFHTNQRLRKLYDEHFANT